MKTLFEFVTLNNRKAAKIHIPIESTVRWINGITNYGIEARTGSVRILKLEQYDDLWLDIYFRASHQTHIDLLNNYKKLASSSKYINDNSTLFKAYLAEVNSSHVLKYELQIDETTNYRDMSVKSDFINLGSFVDFLISREATILRASFDFSEQKRYEEDDHGTPCSYWGSKGYPYIFIWFTNWRENQLDKIRTYKEYKERSSKYVVKIAKKQLWRGGCLMNVLNSIELDPNLTASQKIELINGRTIIIGGEEMDCQDYLEVKHKLVKLQQNIEQHSLESEEKLF